MISSEQILTQIDKQLQQAKMAGNDQSKREALAAIRALCDVILDSAAPSQTPIVKELSTPVLSTQPIALKENDANGESLFDF
ncbi:YwdI family protein [Bacillus sp. FJAT-22090]|uniref:YwdI family protein n=1 Tax=Bacillus sp. FJAT-22090 TaxID=1581038 RepID=UPI00119ED111|nr:YwdI family protein [Bacillus sp. FJAT-22090]